jgi:oligopeptide/dipeptide ABC transporter ATP-binding protein
MRMTDIFLLLPGLPLIILLAAYMDSGITGIAMVIGMTAWPGTARVIRANVLQISRRNFIRSAEVMGAGRLYIMFAHILPNIFHVVLAKGVLAAASAMVTEAGVSFLGLGDPQYKSWGAMLQEAFTNGGLLNGCYGWYLPPIICISMTVLCLTLAGRKLMGDDDQTLLTGRAVGHSPLGSLKPRNDPCLQVTDLSVDFANPDGIPIRAMDRVNLTVNRGRRLAVIGETGSGKSVLLLALMGLLPENGSATGAIRFCGQNLLDLSEKAFCRLRGRYVAYVPQGAGQALNPLIRVGGQVAESLRIHERISRKAALGKGVEMLDRMGIPHARGRSREYPHQYSGGMIQRVLGAMGLISGASLILLDEPTKGLDPENKEAIFDLLEEYTDETFVMVTHDLLFAKRFSDEVAVMLNARIVEKGPSGIFFETPLHPYARALLNAQPSHGMQVEIPFNSEPSHASGCPFADRCPEAFERCRHMPPMTKMGKRSVRCRLYDPENTKSA